ncbi:hypothetical protein AVEN_47024-1 [Araneus ventricosus]|uniref:Endonuclease/exonuclease/phosphatase domain-containing protein n=1 Tax=Araneus ventricosus TaxID=182803 RepID=A0A4Y2F0U9_ARAVE|nr:hypothetical protein AVEN_47024-1 [Araneus ventricosus]
MYRCDKLNLRGGGITVIEKNDINHHEISFYTSTFETSTFVIELAKCREITIASIYRTPHGRTDTAELNKIFCNNYQVICFGDFRAKHPSLSVSRSNKTSQIIYDWVKYSNLLIIAPPLLTYFSLTHTTNSTLDYAIVKNFSAAEATSINVHRSDHNPVFYEFQLAGFLPVHLRVLATTNLQRFQVILTFTNPDNPNIKSTQDIANGIAKL